MLAAKQLILAIAVFLLLVPGWVYAGTITVNSVEDVDTRDDVITLREAILLSEGTLNSDLLTPDEQAQVSTPVGSGEADTIEFGISGTISISPSLPEVTDSGTVIDASSQWSGEWPGGQPGVTLDGDWSNVGLEISGADNCHIRGLLITKFVSGISITDGAESNTTGGPDTGNRNVISGNADGIIIHDSGTDRNVVSGNYIGTDVTGTAAMGNENSGISIDHSAQWNTIGGTTAEERNVISGNVGCCGVVIYGTGTDNNVIKGNYIGVDASGTAALGNSDHGVLIISGAQYNTIGGTTPEERNIISGNIGAGVTIDNAANNTVSGNYIGIDVTGAMGLGHEWAGVVLYLGAQSNTIGGTTPGERNIISGNAIGVSIGNSETGNNVVIGNSIGTDATGTIDLGNEGFGVHIEEGARSNTIGRVGAGNTIAFNGEEGVRIDGGESVFNTISGNSIHDNTELGIELLWGGNDEIQPPNVTWVGLADGILTISGDAAGADAAVEIFEADSSGQEGQIFLGSLIADGSGEFSGPLSVAGKDLSVGDRIVATTTHTDGNTSEFSSPFTVSEEREPPVTGPVLNPANGHYYEVVLEGANWHDAKAAAESRTFNGLQGHLATITSQDENDFLISILSSDAVVSVIGSENVWVGGFQPPGSPEPDGNWQWVTGEPFIYQNWAPWAPDNLIMEQPPQPYGDNPNEDSLEFCIEFGWNDVPGVWKTPGYIVEYEPETIPSHAWTIEYDGSVLPEDADPPWEVSSQGSASTDGDILTINTIGAGCGEQQYLMGGIVNSPTGITVEARVKIGAIGNEGDVPDTAIEINNSTQSFTLVFLEDRIAEVAEMPWDELGNYYLMDTTSDFHVYRITVQNGIANVYVDGVQRLALAGFLSPNNSVVFGETRASCGGMNGLSYWDYVKIDANVAEPPSVPRRLSITSAEASPGDQVPVQLSISDVTGMASGDIIIKYDASVITVVEVTATELLSDILLVPNVEVPGEIGLFMAGTTGLSEGSGAMVEIALTVSPDAEMGTETVLSFGEVRIYDEQGMVIPVNLEDGAVKITWPGVKGDVNDDGEVRSNDAMMALRIAAGLMIPTEYQQWAADMNDDGKVRANDATSILRRAAGLAAPGIGVIASAGGRITVTLSEAHGVAGERVTVPIEADNVDMLASGEICIAYDSTVLRAVDVSCAPDVLLASNTTERGMLRIAFASANRLNSRTMAEIQFDVLADAFSTLRFRTVELYGPDANAVNSIGVDKEFRPWAVHPKHNALLQNFPNPFNPETWIPYQLAEDSEVTVSIYSATGQLIRTMHLGYREAGSYVTRDRAAYWDGKNEAGEEVASGIYFCNIKAGEYTATRKMIARK